MEYWKKDPSNPVLDSADVSAESWEAGNLFNPKVIWDGSQYVMLYSATDDGLTTNNYKIGRATSPDGIVWTRDTANNPVLDFADGESWEDEGIMESFWMWDSEDSIYKMWYSGETAANVIQIGYATSPDGITWTRDTVNNPVIANGANGSVDELWAAKPCVVKMSSTDYRMWYTGRGDAGAVICYALSSDGIAWAKQGAVITRADHLMLYPWVIRESGIFKMWVQKGSGGGSYITVFFTSVDGQTWKERGAALTLGLSGAWDDSYIGVPCVVNNGSETRIFFAARHSSDSDYKYRALGTAILEQSNWGGGSQ